MSTKEKDYIDTTTPLHGAELEMGLDKQERIWDKRRVHYKNILSSVCIYILVMELAERLSYYGINQGLKNFMTDHLHLSQVTANSLKSTWTSLCFLSPLLGAWIADGKLGRFKTILIFGIWYLIGDFMVAIASHPRVLENETLSRVIFMLGLFLGIGVGTGAIKSNVITFGADQFDPRVPEQESQKELFFSTFYWCINIGATVSYSYLAYLSVNGSGIISKEYGYLATFMICACVMFFAIIIFIIGYHRYVHVPPSASALSDLWKTILTASHYSKRAKCIIIGFATFILSFCFNAMAAFASDKNPDAGLAVTIVAACLSTVGIATWIFFGMDPSYMNRAKKTQGGPITDHTIEEIKLVIRVLPFAAFLVMWHCAYDQIDANFQSITQQCDLRLGSSPNASQIPGAALGVFGPISIIIVIPVLDYIIYPAYKKLTGKSASSYGKVLAGLLVATVGMIWTGIFECMRRGTPLLEQCSGDGENFICSPIIAEGGKKPMNEMYWTYAIPQYILIGTAECLINVTAFDVFYSNVPDYLKSTCQAINLFMTAMGSTVTSIFTLAFQNYITEDLNDGHLEYMYFAVGGFSLINIAIYVWCMNSMQFGMSTSRIQTIACVSELRRDSACSLDSKQSASLVTM